LCLLISRSTRRHVIKCLAFVWGQGGTSPLNSDWLQYDREAVCIYVDCLQSTRASYQLINQFNAANAMRFTLNLSILRVHIPNGFNIARNCRRCAFIRAMHDDTYSPRTISYTRHAAIRPLTRLIKHIRTTCCERSAIHVSSISCQSGSTQRVCIYGIRNRALNA
jgi:hypothetical protein